MMQEQCDGTATPIPEKPPTVEQILQLQSVGILSIKEARALVHKYYPSEPNVKREPVVHSEALGDSYATPPPKIGAKRLYSQMELLDVEINKKVRPDSQCPSRPSKKKKKRPNKASPETATIRRLVKDVTRQRFLGQCMATNSPLWKKSQNGQRHMNKILFARAAAKPMSTLYKAYPETLHGVPGRKLMNVIQWQVFFICYFLFIMLGCDDYYFF